MKTKVLFILLILTGCKTPLYRVIKSNPAPGLSSSNSTQDYNISHNRDPGNNLSSSFTFTNEQGQEVVFNQTIVDEESGELVGLRHLNEVTISAKANNIAERNGIITLNFTITVPSILQNSSWQTEMTPILRRGVDTSHFKKIILSGKEFKRAQERGYKRFENYLKSIIPDNVNYLEVFADLPNLAIFLERNLPTSLAIYGELNDSLKTEFGVTEQRIVKQYLKHWLISKNNRKKREKNNMYNKYIKTPYPTGCLLDSVICNSEGDFEYHYRQDIYTNENSSRLNLWISSTIRDINGAQVKLRTSDTIVYNVSSMSGLVQDIAKYKKKIIERKIQINFDANISFPVNKWRIEPSFKQNIHEIEKINQIIYDLISEEKFDLDTLYITSFSSPEGNYSSNKELSNKRALSIKNLLYNSIEKISEHTINLNLGSCNIESTVVSPEIDSSKIVTLSIPEDWDNLKLLIERDPLIIKRELILQAWDIENLDKREEYLKKRGKEYQYIKDSLYPKLRRVNFRLNLLRKGMIKDTIHTTELDTLYMQGVEFLKKREYVKSLAILSHYNDINTAIAHISLGHDHSALQILEKTTQCAKQTYMLAILYARMGFEEKAAQYFLKSKELDIKMAYRGGLDPEISHLINKYNLNKDLFE